MKTPEINANTFIANTANIVGDVIIKENVTIWFQAVIRGDREKIVIEEGVNIQDGCVLHVDESYPVHIGKSVVVGHGSIIHGAKIGEHTLIGMGAIILNGADIGANCIIGAGALVTQNTIIPDGMLVLGSPAKIIRPLTDIEKKRNVDNALEYIEEGKQYKEAGYGK